VSKGKHPSGSGVSGLEYLMRDWATVPPDRGVFLERTWRMHPRLCRFVSDAFYDGRLESAECTNGQMLKLQADCDGILAATGLKFVPIEHTGNSQKSGEEAMALDRAYRSLLGQAWVNQRGETRLVGTEDILVVSPYNMQVNLLKQRLPTGGRVGTVDKFQGQEAAAVLVSMASSSADEAPRGIDFLFSRNRLNVALSRARCLSVIFCSPHLLDVACSDIGRMKLLNTICWVREFANE
jgi:superfamily I DNA and/or RNA helicase